MASRGGSSSLNISTADDKTQARCIFLYDRRHSEKPEVVIDISNIKKFADFRKETCKVLGISDDEKFVITDTNREEVKAGESWDFLEAGDTLYVLQSCDQELVGQAQERVTYLPHYDTIVKGGMYEYYASEGQNPLPYAFAELIDNALAATADNPGPRTIEIHMHLDDQPSKNVIFVTDNGKGMTSHQLNNWAVYRLSKFNRKECKRGPAGDGPAIVDAECAEDDNNRGMPLLGYAPRSLNSDISYFGVGGKQAIFFIGTSTRMISKAKNSKDVHELLISKDEFERREKNHESIYTGYIRNRKAGDNSHIAADEEFLRSAIKQEKDKKNFTNVVINGINPVHVPYLRNHVKEWTRQLAHIYHYYIHGPEGNAESADGQKEDSTPFGNIDIKVSISIRDKPVKVINLRDINDDMQSLYIRSSADSFEFKSVVEGMGIVEGILQYHPFLYDKETFPSDANDPRVIEQDPEDDHADAVDNRPARGRRAIFECFWNGRLIPYTTIDEFDWCAAPKKTRNIPLECYNRISGVLWTNDRFQVSTNKLTFIDLEMKLRDKNTAYTRILGRQEKRTAIEKEFHTWLKDCHEKHDKQVKFAQFGGTISRPELQKNRQSPWGVFTHIEWDGKVFKKGQLVRILRTLPLQYGSIRRFLLHGEYDGDVFATGGDIEIQQEPKSLYDDVKVFPLSKLDRGATQNLIKKYLEEEEAKLPDKLILSWPNGDDVSDGEKRAAGKTIGDLKVEIANRKGELISKLPGSQSRKLLVELKVVWHSPTGDETIVSHISQHGKNWGYWFRKMENVRNLGPHTLTLQAVLNETGANIYAGKTLPCTNIRLTVTEAEPEKFTVGLLDGPFRIGSPFQIPLEFQDEFGHATKPTNKLKPVLEASGIELKYDTTVVKGNCLIIKGITALGLVGSNAGKSFNLIVRVPGLEEDAQTLKIRLLPGPPHSLHVTPDSELEVENGSPVSYSVEVRDEAGNVTSAPKLQVVCKFSGASDLPVYKADLSSSGQGTITGEPINLTKMKSPTSITAKIEAPTHKSISSVQRCIVVKPSSRASRIDVTYLDEAGESAAVVPSQDIFGTAGETIRGVTFKIYDEAGQEKEVDEDLAKKIKVNWNPKLSREQLMKGQLPDIRVPASVTQSTYCSFSVTDTMGLEIPFIVKALPGAPSQLKCRCSCSPQLRLGETISGDILVSVQDKHGNEIKKLDKGVLADLIVTGEGLVTTDMLRGLDQNSGFSISGVRFESGSLGGREVCVEWRGLKGYVRLQMVAGAPAKIALLNYEPSQPVNIFNEKKIPHPFTVQLCDEAGNPCSEANVRVQLARDHGIKLVPSPGALKTNQKGQAEFGVFTVFGKRGVYDIQPKAFMGRTNISGPKLKISIQPDFTKPVSLQVDYEKSQSYSVGDKMPDYTCTVYSESDTVLTTAQPSCVSLRMWKTEGPQVKPPTKATSQSPDSRKKTDKEGVFTFTNRQLPESGGVWYLMFSYNDGNTEIFSNQIIMNVQAGPPVKLVPLQVPGTPTVSNTKSSNNRVLLRSLKLELQDQFHNPTGFDFAGKVQVEISNPDEKDDDIPQFVGGTRQAEFPISNGQALIQNLTILENCGGRDSAEYTLCCRVVSDSPSKTKDIPAYEIPFLFYNDVKKQSQMAALTRERDSLTAAIKTYKSLFETTQQLINELKMSLSEAQSEEIKWKNQLIQSGIAARILSSVNSVDNLMETKIRDRDALRNRPRRMCSVQPIAQHPQVLGKIAHLAEVQEGDIARVLSWHMSADMDCVITLTTKKAKEIYQQSNGKQQVLPLDSIYRKNLPDWNKPLPHVRIRPNWKPQGNPVYARNLLYFPHDEANCKIVFGMLLGDTIILDNLDHANAYRQEIVKFSHCPTILTREGDRIRSNGKFGGLMNKALPIEKLKGVVFGEPLSKDYDTFCNQIDILQNYKTAMQKRLSAADDLQEQVSAHKAPEMQSKLRECEEAEQQLLDLERKLGMSPASIPGGTRVKQLQAFVSPDEPSAKRSRPSVGAVNGSSPSNGTPPTPTRTSSRRNAGAALSTTPSKRVRRN